LEYLYNAFGLNIASEIECPQLVAGKGLLPDVSVRYGSVPLELEQVQARGKFYQIAAGHFLLDIERVARYLVCHGGEITVAPYPHADEGAVRLFLLGSAFGALLHQRGDWPLHGSAIATDRGAAIFLGASGNGKSTLAGAFHQRGCPVLSDDVCAIRVNRDRVAQVWPAYPRLNLWPDAVIKLGREPDQLQRNHNTLAKYELPLPRFSMGPVAIYAIYALYITPQAGVQLTPLKGFEKVQELTSNTYRLHFLRGMQLEQRHFQQAQTLARQARLVRVTRPSQPFFLMNNPKTIDLSETVVQTENLLTSELDGETVMMSLARAAYYGLDATAQRIWSLLAQPCRVADLCDQLVAEYAVDPQVCQREVCAFLTELNQEGLIRVV
jgi:hypothetical protein